MRLSATTSKDTTVNGAEGGVETPGVSAVDMAPSFWVEHPAIMAVANNTRKGRVHIIKSTQETANSVCPVL